MRVRWNEYTYLIMWIYIFDNARIRARWNGPLRWRNVRTPFRGWALVFYGMFVGVLRIVRHIIIIYVTLHRNSSATCLFRDGYAFWKQKPPFCTSKTILLYTKNPLFARQKGGFCSVKKAGLHNKNEQPEKPLPVATMPNTHTPPHNNTTHSAHAYA